MFAYSAVYVIELVSRLYVHRYKFFSGRLNNLDLIVVILDVICQALGEVIGDIPSVSVLRVFRLVRLLRALRLLTSFRELYIMLHSFIGAMQAITWASLMLFVVLTIWAIIAVETLHPLSSKLAQQGAYGDCERCERAYSTVMNASLTFFQQIVAGDSWGEVTIPLLEYHPWTVVIIIPAFISVGMGLLNLVLTVIVDRAEGARRSNEEESTKLKLQVIKQIFKQMDDDGSGCVSLVEFLDGVNSYPDFAKALGLLHLEVDDVITVFQVMDADGSGTVSYNEFVENLAKIKKDESYLVLLFVKHFHATMEKRMQGMLDRMGDKIEHELDLIREDLEVIEGCHQNKRKARKMSSLSCVDVAKGKGKGKNNKSKANSSPSAFDSESSPVDSSSPVGNSSLAANFLKEIEDKLDKETVKTNGLLREMSPSPDAARRGPSQANAPARLDSLEKEFERLRVSITDSIGQLQSAAQQQHCELLASLSLNGGQHLGSSSLRNGGPPPSPSKKPSKSVSAELPKFS
eukprot:gnl/TRDRNA2_/TRDRNA2_171327_c2_seq1.p1 gnl/TRDRNA2_/TRDRNA2_171327_c2~~gnl/TRDRNA2_/TRDRNA2_171327_c2_seq1.p1  ORF type:complete len:543 (+),score=108.74 gnl/TRDRNA2_/TRDRNA2_171327_c2_seq1:78-1631(+)